MAKSRLKNKKPLIILGTAVVALLVFFGVSALTAVATSSRYAPPVSAKVQEYYNENSTKLPTPVPLPRLSPVPAGAKVLIVGDSFVQGHAAIPPEAKGYAPLLAELEGWDATIDGVGATGLTTGGDGDRLTYAKRIAAQPVNLNPVLVFIQGSQNDYKADRGQLATAANEVIALVREKWPNAQLVIMGPTAPLPKGPTLEPIVTGLAYAAFDAKVPYINPINSYWFTTDNSPKYAHTDGWHLNTEGHAFLASKVKEALDAIGAKA